MTGRLTPEREAEIRAYDSWFDLKPMVDNEYWQLTHQLVRDLLRELDAVRLEVECQRENCYRNGQAQTKCAVSLSENAALRTQRDDWERRALAAEAKLAQHEQAKQAAVQPKDMSPERRRYVQD